MTGWHTVRVAQNIGNLTLGVDRHTFDETKPMWRGFVALNSFTTLFEVFDQPTEEEARRACEHFIEEACVRFVAIKKEVERP